MEGVVNAALQRYLDQMNAINLQSTLTCPLCGHSDTETMPTDACQIYYDCKGCGKALRPKQGDCCVFCSYGSEPCPSIQQTRQNGKIG